MEKTREFEIHTTSQAIDQLETHLKKMTEQCYIKDGFIVFNVDYEYNINLSRCDTPAKILGWVQHLCEKTWITRELIERFISLATRHNKIKINLGV